MTPHLQLLPSSYTTTNIQKPHMHTFTNTTYELKTHHMNTQPSIHAHRPSSIRSETQILELRDINTCTHRTTHVHIQTHRHTEILTYTHSSTFELSDPVHDLSMDLTKRDPMTGWVTMTDCNVINHVISYSSTQQINKIEEQLVMAMAGKSLRN